MIAKRNERAKGAVKKVEELNESFSKETKAKLEKKLQTKEEKRRQQLEALQCRVQQHVRIFMTSYNVHYIFIFMTSHNATRAYI